MKKLKMVLLAAMVFGVASAFTTTSKMSMTSAWGADGHEVDPNRVGEQFDCLEGSNYCLYQEPELINPLPGESQDKQFVYYGK